MYFPYIPIYFNTLGRYTSAAGWKEWCGTLVWPHATIRIRDSLVFVVVLVQLNCCDAAAAQKEFSFNNKAVSPRGSKKRKSNNDDTHGHGQEKRRPTTLS